MRAEIREILNQTSHRPWPIPNENWRYYQEWNQAIFLHWEVEFKELKQFIPKELEIDLFEGRPWVSIVAFTMEKIRPRSLPALSPISNFHEINVRTYIRSKHKKGVYFLSIEGSKSLSCKVAKEISGLPYRHSRIKRTQNTYKSSNKIFNDTLHIEYDIGDKKGVKTELDIWLTERYALFLDDNKSTYEFETHHLEWPIQDVSINKLQVHYPRFNQLIQKKPDYVHYSNGVKVLAWEKKGQFG